MTTIRRSLDIPGQQVTEFKGIFNGADGKPLELHATQTSRSSDPNSFYAEQKPVDATFDLKGSNLPALEYIGVTKGMVKGVETKSETYQVSFFDKSDRRYNAVATVRYIKTNADKWLAVTGQFELQLTHQDSKTNQTVLNLFGPGIAQSILHYPQRSSLR